MTVTDYQTEVMREPAVTSENGEAFYPFPIFSVVTPETSLKEAYRIKLGQLVACKILRKATELALMEVERQVARSRNHVIVLQDVLSEYDQSS